MNYRYAECEVKVFHKLPYVRFMLNEIKSTPIKELIEVTKFNFKNKPKGVYSENSKTAYVFPGIIYEITEPQIKDCYKMLCASVLIHELRHYFQHQYMKKKWSNEKLEEDARRYDSKIFIKLFDDLHKLTT